MKDKIKSKEKVKIHCVTCHNQTNHEILWNETRAWSNDEDGIWGDSKYAVLSCLGCEEITFRRISTFSEDMEQVGDEYVLNETITYYPLRDDNLKEKKCDNYQVPIIVKKVYNETIDAYNNGQSILCAIGIRTIIEAICIESKTKGRNLEIKINKLKENKIISDKIAEGLHENRLLGNESAHEIEVIGNRELLAGIELMEEVIINYYMMEEKINLLKLRKKTKTI